MTFDPRWTIAASEWLRDYGLTTGQVSRYADKLAQRLQDVAEEFAFEDVPQAEQERHDATRDAAIERKIDEARGK